MQYFNFRRLIEKYISDFTVITYGESVLNDRGKWEKGERKEITLKGAIIGRGENAIFRSEGKLTEKDKRLFMLQPIDKALLTSKVIYEKEVYSIMSSSHNAKFTGVYAYTMKYVSAFDEKDGDGE